jgi:Protein of unknown function (DUF3300)
MSRHLLVSIGLAATLALGACGKKEAGAPAESVPATAQPAQPVSAPAATAATPTTPATPGTWTPEALEELLAPIALYPDVVLGHVLTASTNPQEVLDAGNWLIAHQDLTGSALDDEAAKLGFSPSTRALLQFPETVDMMCMQMDWTTQLGQAFTADQGAVLDAVQRLRTQAKDVGNLESSKQLKVETKTEDGKEAVTVAPADPQVVYVPKYDPQAVYAPPPATIPPPTTINITPAPGTTITTSDGQVATTTAAPTTTITTTTEEKGHSTGALITTGLLAFGAGILVNEVFDDDDDWDDYHPNYWGGSMYYGGHPYYPPPPYMYRPPYGPGFYPSNGYNRPPNYQHGFNNNTIIVNNGGNDYWNRNSRNSARVDARPAKSPITAAKPNRPELNDLNRQASDRTTRQREQASTRTANLGGQTRETGYAGARPENKAARDRMVQNSPKPAGVAQDLPKRPQGTYAGAKDRPAAAQRPAAATAAKREPPKQRPAGTVDRGREGPGAARPEASRPDLARERQGSPTVAQNRPDSRPDVARDRPADAPAQRPSVDRQGDRTAFQTNNARPARAEHAASQRGRSSMPSGAHGGRQPRR